MVTAAIRRCEMPREQIAAAMSEALGMRVTVRMLNDWTAESHEQHRFPAFMLPAFCRIVGDYRPLKALVRAAGLVAVSKDQRNLLALGKACAALRRAEMAMLNGGSR